MAERWWWELAKPITDVQPGEEYQLKVKREAIPIVFLPGIMGTRLKQKRGGDKVWDPDHAWFMLTTYGLVWQRGGKKKQLLVGDSYDEERPDFLEVFEDDDKHNKKRLPPKGPGEKEGPVERGWGGVMWSAYGDVLKKLANPRTWREEVAPVGLFFDLPVYAVGYNWTADVKFAAEEVAERIDGIIGKYKEQKCRQVILVTHSMGGIVARTVCNLPGMREKVLGAVHGVQPAHGSAAACWRMKGGFERANLAQAASAWVLGTDGKEVTQTLAEMPGGLALLPNELYGKGWLTFFDFAENRERSLPQSDPYEEIYRLKEPYWRLVDPDWLIGPKTKTKREGRKTEEKPENAWSVYVRNLGLAEQVSTKLEENLQHPETHWFMGTGLHSAGTVRFDRTRYVPAPDYPPPVGVVHCRNKFVTYIQRGSTVYSVRMGRPTDDGDGTVPSSSASALKQQGESHAFKLGDPDPPQAAFEGMEHQPAFGEPEGIDFTADAIRRLCLHRMKLGGQ